MTHALSRDLAEQILVQVSMVCGLLLQPEDQQGQVPQKEYLGCEIRSWSAVCQRFLVVSALEQANASSGHGIGAQLEQESWL